MANKLKPDTPTVSVIMAAYNAQAYLAEAVESVLGQTLADFELLIVDDGSTDDTPAIIERYARLDARIRVIRLARNGGVANAKNTALRHAQASFVAICDADDRQLPERLARQVAALKASPQRVMVGCRVKPFGDVATSPADWLPVDETAARARILFQALYGDAANLFRRELVDLHGLHYSTAAVWEDWVFQTRALHYGEAHVLPEVLLHYRRHAAQQTSPDRLKASVNRTKATMLHVLGEAGVVCSQAELDLHHAISPSPFGLLSDPDYLCRHRNDFFGRAQAWLRQLAEATARSGWTSEAAFGQVAEEILKRLPETMWAVQDGGRT